MSTGDLLSAKGFAELTYFKTTFITLQDLQKLHECYIKKNY